MTWFSYKVEVEDEEFARWGFLQKDPAVTHILVGPPKTM